MILLFLMSLLAHAASLSVEIDQRELVVGQTVPLKIKVIDGSPRGVPEVPVGSGLLLRFQGQSQQHVVSNFQSRRIVQYTYELSATRPGSWFVGPLDILVDGQRLGAAPITIRVGEAPADQGGLPVMGTLTDTAPFLGQVVVFRLQFKRNRPVVGVEWTPPTFDGFVAEKVAEQAQREYSIVENNQNFTVQTIEVPLVAAAVGPNTVPPAVISARYRAQRRRRNARRNTLDDIFGGSSLMGSRAERKTHTTSPIPLNIRPLPQAGRPADFGGLVGRFTLQMKPSARKLKLGESLTLTIVLKGDGTLHGFRLPTVPSDAGFRVYDDAPEITAEVKDRIFLSQAVVKRAVVPEEVGTLTIPGIEIPIFDPETEQYTTVRTESLSIVVEPGEEGAGDVSSFLGEDGDARRAVESLGEDILPVSVPDRLQDSTLMGSLPIIGALPALPLLVWLALVVNGWLDSRKIDPLLVQRRRMMSLPKDPVRRLAILEDVFREVAGLRLGVPAPSLDADAVSSLGEDAQRIYRALERARYGGSSGGLDALAAQVSRFLEGK